VKTADLGRILEAFDYCATLVSQELDRWYADLAGCPLQNGLITLQEPAFAARYAA
jgi:hypothetical protein